VEQKVGEKGTDLKYAYCTSLKCTRNPQRGTPKYLARFQRRCPDCGNHLIWRRTPSKKNRIKRAVYSWGEFDKKVSHRE